MYTKQLIKFCSYCGKKFITLYPKKKCCCKKCTKALWKKFIKETGHNKCTKAGRQKNIIPWNKNKICPQLAGKNNGFYGKQHTNITKAKIKEAVYKTKKSNNSFHISKEEQKVKKLLQQKFKEVKYQYKSKVYPFVCDFYIPELDLYLECNFHWTHGIYNHKVYGEYDKDNPEHQALLELWKSKNTKYYNIAIKTWTERDILKQQFANKNNLNYKKFYTLYTCIEWINNL